MIDEDALYNMANYESIIRIKMFLGQMLLLQKMSEQGIQTAQCIYMDLEQAIKSNKLTNRQQECLRMKYIDKETNVWIGNELGISESAVRKNIEGGLKRVRKILLGQI
jgi:RNA polymerase sigma factor (sigma-70 family)